MASLWGGNNENHSKKEMKMGDSLSSPPPASSSNFKVATESGGKGVSLNVNAPKSANKLSSLCEKEARMAKRSLVDLGSPMVNRVVDNFLLAAGVGALQSMSRDAVHVSLQGMQLSNGNSQAISASPKSNFNKFQGETSKQCFEKMVEHATTESLQWGLAAGIYSGVTFGLEEARGKHDLSHSAIAGALVGASLSVLSERKPCLQHALQSAISGSALAVASTLVQKYT